MKMLAGRERDEEDLVAMWPHVGFTAEEAVAEFWKAYPAAPPDEYLCSWIEGIATKSRARRS